MTRQALIAKLRENTDTMGLQEASAFTRLHYQTLRARARAGQIPGASKPGKEWVFLRIGLLAYLQGLSPCRSTVLGKSGMSISPARGNPADDYDALLGLPTRRKHRNTTKNSGANYGDTND